MGLLDTTEINPRENPLSEEDKAKEIQGVKDFYKKGLSGAILIKWE